MTRAEITGGLTEKDTVVLSAVNNRDVPVIQLIVLILAGFYVFVNIASDVIALLASPRRRRPRSS